MANPDRTLEEAIAYIVARHARYEAELEAARPDDISKDIWDQAIKLFGICQGQTVPAVEVLARAVMDATAEEREACARIADERAAICADAVAKIEAGELYQTFPRDAKITENCARMEASHIAKVIRQRAP